MVNIISVLTRSRDFYQLNSVVHNIYYVRHPCMPDTCGYILHTLNHVQYMDI